MKNSRLNFINATLLSCFLFLVACSGPQLKFEPIPVSANPTEEATKLETELVNARQQQVNILAPSWFSKAEASLAESKKLIAQKGAMGEIGINVSRGHAELVKAQEMAKISRTAIPEAIKGRDMARVAGATSFGQDYADVEAQFLNLTRAIEDNNLSYAQRNQKKVVDAFQVIEIRAIKETTLGEVRKLLVQAEKEGAKKLAPEVLNEVQKELQDVDAFISANPYAKEEMHKKANAALFKAGRLVQLTRQSEMLRKMQPIDIALWSEAAIKKTAERLGAPDMRDQPFDTQVDNILGTASSLVSDRDFLSKQSKSQQDELLALKMKSAEEIASLQAKLDIELGKLEKAEAVKRMEQEHLAAEKRAAEEKLASERKFNELYNQVQALFAKEEAECYKQGQQMVVRLRGMSFPVGQSLIMPENYALLSKVQQAIRTFESPDITIEGHTDSTGALELNNHLSQKRAEAVRDYLLANSVSTEDKVTSVGYGPSRPLAPNTTTEGRAQNRRIDVIITPKGQSIL
ncbi:MAG: OmpA family protein [Deltaproteobacteria bacterium]|jgi:outer membrane protein OmpA-like peptidoglycan-associated protein|nr:OmpA family protein [Deltaproteobacteria bacterium]MCW8893944.1 OmpA family protein [Deltaproteobacteria bacterium]MCW9048803.1 OmpA family protein [Deltaproteobacteria bacterium]